MQTPNQEQYTVELGVRGRLVFPAPLRKQLFLQDGDKLIFRLTKDGSISVSKLQEQVSSLKGILKQKNRKLSEELIKERRQAAHHE